MTLLTVRCPLCPWHHTGHDLNEAITRLEAHRDNECEGVT